MVLVPIAGIWERLAENLLFASAYARLAHDLRNHPHSEEICLADFQRPNGLASAHAIPFAMQAFRRLKGRLDRLQSTYPD